MSKDTVCHFLKKNKDWFTIKQVAEGIKTNISSTTRCLKKLRIDGSAEVKPHYKGKHHPGNVPYKYRIKRMG